MLERVFNLIARLINLRFFNLLNTSSLPIIFQIFQLYLMKFYRLAILVLGNRYLLYYLANNIGLLVILSNLMPRIHAKILLTQYRAIISTTYDIYAFYKARN